MDNFLLLPHSEVFETAQLARTSNQADDNSCVKLFKLAWLYYVDKREKRIYITQELDQHLIKNHYKSAKEKRQALFATVFVFPEPLGSEDDFCMARLASRLSMSLDSKIYLVIDNPEKKKIFESLLDGTKKSDAVKRIEIIDSKRACGLLASPESMSNGVSSSSVTPQPHSTSAE